MKATTIRWHWIVLALSAILFPGPSSALEPFPQDPSDWLGVPLPEGADRVVWEYAANRSPHRWQVRPSDRGVIATLDSGESADQAEEPPFQARAEGFEGASVFERVDDGWLVGFNLGEFGAALYWFSVDGRSHYRISNHHVVDMIRVDGEVLAIEGLAHLSASRGSLIRIRLDEASERWQALTMVELPFAPRTVSVDDAGTLYIALSNALVTVDRDFEMHILHSDLPWWSLYPRSSAWSKDRSTLYIGMRQYVCEYTLATGTLRYLVPSLGYLNKLNPEDERQIRKVYGSYKR